MGMRNIVLLGSLAMVLGGCVVAPSPYDDRGYYSGRDYYGDDGYYDYHTTPSYQGYYYVRVIFIGSIPYYVDDDRYVRPIPPHMHDHFRNSPFRQSAHRYPPVFSRDRDVRDGYPASRIVYFNDVPHYVEDDRIARPLPGTAGEQFRRSPFNQNSGSSTGSRPPPAAQQPYVPPTYGRDNPPPAYGRDNPPPPYGGGSGSNVPPAYGRDGRDNPPPAYGRGNPPPPFGRTQPPVVNQPPAQQQPLPPQTQPVPPQPQQRGFQASPFRNKGQPQAPASRPPADHQESRPAGLPQPAAQQPPVRDDEEKGDEQRRGPPPFSNGQGRD